MFILASFSLSLCLNHLSLSLSHTQISFLYFILEDSCSFLYSLQAIATANYSDSQFLCRIKMFILITPPLEWKNKTVPFEEEGSH